MPEERVAQLSSDSTRRASQLTSGKHDCERHEDSQSQTCHTECSPLRQNMTWRDALRPGPALMSQRDGSMSKSAHLYESFCLIARWLTRCSVTSSSSMSDCSSMTMVGVARVIASSPAVAIVQRESIITDLLLGTWEICKEILSYR